MKTEQRIVKFIRVANLIFMCLVSLCILSHQAQAEDCTFGGAATALGTETRHTEVEYQRLARYLEVCLREFGGAYKSAPTETPLKQGIVLSDNASIINALAQGIHTTLEEDRQALLGVERWSRKVKIVCQRDQNIQIQSSVPGETFGDNFLNYSSLCSGISRLSGMNLAYQPAGATEAFSDVVLIDGDAEQNAAVTRCLTPEGGASPLDCAMACGPGPACTAMGIVHDSDPSDGFDVLAIALACAQGTRTDNCDDPRITCPIETPLSECSAATATRERTITPPGTGTDGNDVATAAVDPINTPPENPVNTPPSDATSAATQADLNNAMETAANNVFGEGEFNFRRQNPNGNIQVPEVKMDLDLDSSPLAKPTVRGASQISPVAVNKFNPSALFPAAGPSGQAGAGGAQGPGGAADQAAPPGGGFSGGQGANLGAAGAGGGAPGKKRRRGRSRGSNLGKIADGLAGNSFMGADGAKKSGRPKPEGNPLDPRVREKMKENQARALADSGTLNADLARNLLRAGTTKKGLFLKASYFPDSTEVYLEMIETRDLLSPEGL